ncbi:hypothetical protein D3C80_1632050 [compost metagenome]
MIAGIVVGRITREIVCQRVAPSANEDSFKFCGKEASASAATLVIVGRIITDSTSAPAATPMPWPGNVLRKKGTMTLRPTKPYTTEGIPESSSITGCSSFFPQPGTISVMNSAAHILRGLAISAASSVTRNEPAMKGSAP